MVGLLLEHWLDKVFSKKGDMEKLRALENHREQITG